MRAHLFACKLYLSTVRENGQEALTRCRVRHGFQSPNNNHVYTHQQKISKDHPNHRWYDQRGTTALIGEDAHQRTKTHLQLATSPKTWGWSRFYPLPQRLETSPNGFTTLHHSLSSGERTKKQTGHGHRDPRGEGFSDSIPLDIGSFADSSSWEIFNLKLSVVVAHLLLPFQQPLETYWVRSHTDNHTHKTNRSRQLCHSVSISVA